MEKDLNKKAVTAGMWYIVSIFLIRGISFITTPIFSRILTEAQLGNVKTFESWMYLFTPIMALSMYDSIARAKYDHENDYNQYISSVQTLNILFTCAVFLISIPFYSTVSKLLDMSLPVYLTFFLYLLSHPSVLYMQNREKQLLNYKSNILISALMSLPPTLIALALIFIFKKSGSTALDEARIIGMFIPQAIVGFVIIILLYKKGHTFINLKYWKYALKFSLPLIPYALSVIILNQSNLLMIKASNGETVAGLYSLAVTIVYIVELLSDSIINAWEPWAYENMNAGNYKPIKKAWLGISCIYGGISFLIIMFAPELIWVLGGEKYASAVYVVPPLITGTVLYFLCRGCIKAELFYKKTFLASVGTIIAAALNVALNYYFLFVKGFDYKIAAYSTAFCYLMLLAVHAIFTKLIEKKQISISTGMTFVTGIVFIVLNLSAQLLYSKTAYIRYVIVVALFIIAFVLVRKKIPLAINYVKGFLKKNK